MPQGFHLTSALATVVTFRDHSSVDPALNLEKIGTVAAFVSGLRKPGNHSLSGVDQRRRLGWRQNARVEQVVHLTDEGLEVPDRTSVFSGVHHVYRVLQLGHQRVVLALIQESLAEQRIHDVDDGLRCLLRRQDYEADRVRRPATRVGHRHVEVAGGGNAMLPPA